MDRNRIAFASRLAVCLVLAASLLSAQQKGGGPPPEAETLIKAFIEKTGGEKAHLAVTSSRLKAKIVTQVGRDLVGDLNLSFARLPVTEADGKKGERFCYRMLLDFGDDLRVEKGSDGIIHWEITSYSGARIVPEKEARGTLADYDLAALARRKDYYESFTTRGKVMVGQRPAWEVELKRKDSPRQEFLRFDVETGLLVGQKSIEKTDNGDVVSTIAILDWMKLGDLTIPKATRDEGVGYVQTTTLATGEINPKLAAKDFEPPAVVKKLLEEPAKDEGGES